MKKKLLIPIIGFSCCIFLLYTSTLANESKKGTTLFHNIEVLDVSESSENPCKASGGICMAGPTLTMGLHYEDD